MTSLALRICIAAVLVTACGTGKIEFTETPEGGISSICLDGDDMNWILAPDGSQYEWIDAGFQWGLGTLKVDGVELGWTNAANAASASRGKAVFDITESLSLEIGRKSVGGDIFETYTFTNSGQKPLNLSEIDVNTPFNDNYPDAQTCLSARCHAHIWAAGTAAYVCAERMNAKGPAIGLMMTSGSLNGYSIKERSREKGMSNYRGVICLNPADAILEPGASYSFSWRIFPHQGREDFFTQMLKRGGLRLSADRYVAAVGDTVKITACRGSRNRKVAEFDYVIDRTGDISVPFEWGGGKTWVEVHGVSDIRHIVTGRAAFVLDHQVYNKPGDPRDGAILPYDNATDTQYLEWMQKNNWSDANEGRERVGSAIFLAYHGKVADSSGIAPALERYCNFVRHGLQDENFNTWSDVGKVDSRIAQPTQRDRIYNYPWITHLYCQMFELTGDRKYLEWAYGTQMACYRHGGYNFYAIDVPVVQSITLLRGNGMQAQADSLLAEYARAAETYVSNGLNYPKSEVNYEQSIVAPSVNFLLEMYLVTREQRYLDCAREMMPVLEVFGGPQPSCHLHDIGIRHWDGYWFGLPRTWGDTFPHYWSCITADCFANYALCIKESEPELASSYESRAKAIVLQNLCLFTEEGRAGAAFLYPNRVNGEPVCGLSPFANDQDFALMYFMKLNGGVQDR